MISFQEICEAFTLRHLARPRPALSTEVEKVTKNRLGSPQINLYVGPCWPTERKKNHEAVGTASVKISFSIRFLLKCFFSLTPFTG